MNSFRKVPRDVSTMMLYRQTLLSQRPEFFRAHFEGRLPSDQERLQFIEQALAKMSYGQLYENDTYCVEVADWPPFLHLDIRRHDGGSIKQWYEIQQIKNALVGPEYEAIELYPAESRLVDTGNEYHIWVHSDPQFRFPVGFNKRWVIPEGVLLNSGSNAEEVAA